MHTPRFLHTSAGSERVTHLKPLFGLLLLALTSCGPDTGAPPSVEDPVRTADPFARGLSESDFPRVQEIAPGVFTYEQLRSAGSELFTTVSLFMVTDEGVLVADGQGNVEETERLLDHIADITPQLVTHLVIGSDHGDHTAGNAAFPAGIVVYAHPTSATVLAEVAQRAEGRWVGPPVTHEVPDQETLVLGGRTVEILFLGRAHTGGDLVVHLPEERVLFMSEAYLHRVFPAMRTAFPTEWIQMIERAQALEPHWVIPGHGFVDSPQILREELEVFREALIAVVAEGTRLHREGVPLEEAMEVARFGALEEWSLRESQGPIAIRQIYAELENRLP